MIKFVSLFIILVAVSALVLREGLFNEGEAHSLDTSLAALPSAPQADSAVGLPADIDAPMAVNEAPVAATSQESSRTVPTTALVNLRKAASPSVMAILEDGVVTLDEVTAATRAAYECTASGTRDVPGIALEPPAVGDPSHLFGFTAKTKEAGDRAHAIYNTCNETYYRDVATAWGAGT